MKKLLAILTLAALWPGSSKGQVTHPHGVIGNGATQASGGTYQVIGTAGQPLIGMGTVNKEKFLFSGYWIRNFATQLPQMCKATGSITREVWNNVPGTSVSSIPLNTPPASTPTLTSLESPTNAGDNYGVRIRGYICIPKTDVYTFYLAAADDAELWIGPAGNPAEKVKFASVTGWTNPKEWTKYPTQKSATYIMGAGQLIYIEILHKEGVGGDNLAVGWATGHDGAQSPVTVVPGSVLSPFVNPNARAGAKAAAPFSETGDEAAGLKAWPNPFSDKVTLRFTATETALSSLVLLDAQGVPVKQVLEEPVEAGATKTVEVDGRGLKPGMYLVRLTSGRRVSHQKLVLVR
jgi:hypothetical protein